MKKVVILAGTMALIVVSGFVYLGVNHFKKSDSSRWALPDSNRVQFNNESVLYEASYVNDVGEVTIFSVSEEYNYLYETYDFITGFDKVNYLDAKPHGDFVRRPVLRHDTSTGELTTVAGIPNFIDGYYFDEYQSYVYSDGGSHGEEVVQMRFSENGISTSTLYRLPQGKTVHIACYHLGCDTTLQKVDDDTVGFELRTIVDDNGVGYKSTSGEFIEIDLSL